MCVGFFFGLFVCTLCFFFSSFQQAQNQQSVCLSLCFPFLINQTGLSSVADETPLRVVLMLSLQDLAPGGGWC